MSKKEIKILVGESNPTHQRAIANVFKQIGQTVDFVTNGVTLLNMLEREPYTHVFVDSKLPRFDCNLLADYLDETQLNEGTTVELIAMAVNVFPPHWDENVFDDSLAKPLQVDAVKKCLTPIPQTGRLPVLNEW